MLTGVLAAGPFRLATRRASARTSSLHKFAAPLISVLASLLLLAACASDEKAKVAEETWDCMANAGDPEVFETSMLMMFPTASSLDEAKEQYIYVSSAASLEELKAGRDEACGGTSEPVSFTEPTGTATPTETSTAAPARTSDVDSITSGSTECAVGLILNPGDECTYDSLTIRIREDGAAVLDGDIGGIGMGNTVMDAPRINLNRFSASRSGATWTINSLP